jgi:MFS family permease
VIEFSGRLGALKYPLFRRFWLGSFASVGATQLQILAQGWLLYELTESTLMLGYLGAAASLPTLTMTLFGGALADSIDKRLLMLTTSLLMAILLVLLCALDYFQLVTAWHIIAIAAAISFITGFDWPARTAIMPSLIERDEMLSAVALSSIVWQSSRMIVPAIGGIILSVADTWVAFALCAAGFISMFVVMLSMNIKLPGLSSVGSPLEKVAEGLRFIWQEPIFLLLTILSFAAMGFGFAYIQLMPAFSALLDLDESGYGFLISATGFGSVAGTILIGNLQHSKRLGQLILATAFASCLFLYGFTLVTGVFKDSAYAYALCLACIFGASVFSSMYMIMSLTVLQLKVPDALRGRVMGIHGMCYSFGPLGGLAAGALAAYLTTPGAIAALVTCYIILLIVIGARYSAIRNLSGQHAVTAS